MTYLKDLQQTRAAISFPVYFDVSVKKREKKRNSFCSPTYSLFGLKKKVEGPFSLLPHLLSLGAVARSPAGGCSCRSMQLFFLHRNCA